jgi:hypothetical protein
MVVSLAVVLGTLLTQRDMIRHLFVAARTGSTAPGRDLEPIVRLGQA